MPKFSLYYHPLYSDGLDRTARFPVDRYRLLAEQLPRLDIEQNIQIKEPRLANREEILLVHERDFVDRFLSNSLSEKEVRRIGLKPWKPEIISRTLRLVGGALDALNDLLEGALISGNMAGGTHHAFRGEGAGYCIFNDLAVCTEVALQQKNINRVLILDLDVHQGDGTAEIFAGDERVYTVSLHGENNFPFRKKRSDLDIGFPDGMKDEKYLDSLDRVLEKLALDEFDLIFFQAGVDGLASDALGLLSLSREGLDRRNKKVFEWRRSLGIPLLIFMGGGYAKPITDTVDAFCDLFLEASREVVSITEN
ncbi:MAG: histone deacetylase [Opitutae bacterium]|nr:histone deacetylase [Opitutae bacterium]